MRIFTVLSLMVFACFSVSGQEASSKKVGSNNQNWEMKSGNTGLSSGASIFLEGGTDDKSGNLNLKAGDNTTKKGDINLSSTNFFFTSNSRPSGDKLGIVSFKANDNYPIKFGIGTKIPNRTLEVTNSTSSFVRIANPYISNPNGYISKSVGLELGSYNNKGEFNEEFKIIRNSYPGCGSGFISLNSSDGGNITYSGKRVFINANANGECNGTTFYGSEVVLGRTGAKDLLVGNVSEADPSRPSDGPRLFDGYTFGVNGKSYVNGTLTIGYPSKFEKGFPDGYSLYVDKGILTEKVKVSLKNTDQWADYVFNGDYKLKTLESVESFINENKHLPDIPSAEEVLKSGIDVAKMDAKLLQKIEELTLYTIQQEKMLNQQNKKIEDLTKDNKETKKLASQLLTLTKRLEQLEAK